MKIFTSLKEGSKSTIRTINSLDIIENAMAIEIVINSEGLCLRDVQYDSEREK